MREVFGLFCMLVLLRGLVSKHLTDASISAAACEASWFRPGGLTCDWWAAVNIHIQKPGKPCANIAGHTNTFLSPAYCSKHQETHYDVLVTGQRRAVFARLTSSFASVGSSNSLSVVPVASSTFSASRKQRRFRISFQNDAGRLTNHRSNGAVRQLHVQERWLLP